VVRLHPRVLSRRQIRKHIEGSCDHDHTHEPESGSQIF